ncbi:unnamed protein product [Malus baccata var. baccata]
MIGSFHNKTIEVAGNLMNQKTHIETVVVKQSEEARMAYRTCLNVSIDCTKFLLRQSLSFRGHDESDTSNNRDLVHSCSIETIKTIISDMKNAWFFSLLVDETRDVSINEQMAVVLRYVDKNGKVIESLITMFSSVVNVLEMIVDDNINDSVIEANRLLKDIQSFEVVFLLFLMKSILGITNDLSQALQKDDQEIVNAMTLVNTCKEQLLYMRNDEGFDLLVDKLTELNDRFNEASIELVICLASLSPNDSFAAFDKEKLLRLTQLYPQVFTEQDLLALEDQLDIYIHSMRSRSDFSQLQSISDLAKKMVEKVLNADDCYETTEETECAYIELSIVVGQIKDEASV